MHSAGFLYNVMMLTHLKIKGAIFGHLIGDALTTRCRTQTRQPTSASISQLLARSYGDAGAMTLATMSSILEVETIDLQDIAFGFKEWYLGSHLESGSNKGRVTVSQTIRMLCNGMPPDRCGSKEEFCDNTALIRMLPIAIWTASKNISTIAKTAHETTQFTNGQPLAQVVSALYCLLIRNMLFDEEGARKQLLNFYLQNDSSFAKIIQKFTEPPEPKSSNEVVHSFFNAWNSFNKNKHDFEKMMTSALLFDSEWDTACLAGSLGGCYLGINEIPERWINQLDLTEEAQSIIEEFAERAGKFKFG